ncbi:DUF2497 domain-containing protein [Haematospirillum sp. H1815]|uniref:DUF2497 domain-containing protein n=1 Tax=Haematospirillum sp. H1815 TaxID=2723108 RepID=UPI00143C11B2|nr:DUF2497 domain-containing protein [Haematospirillum sp. H1815]NKD76448.1 DUF2497 domain-containing protein [Haematospirillum sp. H1815]
MDGKGQEPSMEDILASIRKILSEDEEAETQQPPQQAPVQPSEPASAPEADGDDVLELTPAMVEDDEEPLVLGAAPEPPPAPPSQESWAVEEDEGELEPAPVKVSPTPTMTADDGSALLSPPAAAQSAAAFSELATIARVRAIGMGHSDVTLEGMVRDMLKPMLASWLDQHLPDMVERLVRKEIEKLVSGTEKQ